MSSTMMIRYMGADHARRFVIQRSDDKFWTGHGWSDILDNAKVFTDHKEAQTTVSAIQYKQWQGKPVRKFKVEVEITLVGDDIDNISQEQLAVFLAKAVRIDVETSIYGDGPVDGTFVQAQMKLKTLEEKSSQGKRF